VNHNQSPIDALVLFASDIDDTDRKIERERRERAKNENSFKMFISMSNTQS